MMGLAWESCQVVVPPGAGQPGLKLEARRSPAAAGGSAVVAPPHPLYGGTFHNPVVIGLAEGLARAGVATLTFNWRGTEASEGSKTDSLEAAVADYRAALASDALHKGARVFAAGYSFGAATALLAAREEPRVEGVIMLAPPIGMLRAEDLIAAPGRVLVIVGSDDEFAPLPALEEALAVRADVTLDVIAGADHFFHFGGLHEIAERVVTHVSGW